MLQELVVIGMGADPKPNDHITVSHAHGAVTDTNPCRVDRWVGMHLLEVEPRMRRVFPEQPIGFAGLSLDVRRQGREQLTEAPGCARVHSRSGSSSSVKPLRYSVRASRA